ncbi:zf-HC2 domain-containing protein [Corynebacterium sp. 11A]|uniref:zf-HC2 domain-containing protein n=1 Tax=Corynebacterium sp. 11A TaxID=2080510 RepID=UPI00124EB30F|nr:zf-HC2 domain-containing protein [Corynebacterium sp. 11A]
MMDCAQVQAALSARLDGEPTGINDDALDAHLSQCSDCRAFLNEAAALKRSLNFCVADDSDGAGVTPPDLSEMILAGVEPQRRRQASRRAIGVGISRVLLAICALAFLFWGIQLFAAAASVQQTWEASELDPYLARMLVEGATVRFALAFGLVFAVWRSRIAMGLLPVYGALFTFSLGFGARDMVLGAIDRDSVYWLLLVGLSAVVLLCYWLADRGLVALELAWRQLSAMPMQSTDLR